MLDFVWSRRLRDGEDIGSMVELSSHRLPLVFA